MILEPGSRAPYSAPGGMRAVLAENYFAVAPMGTRAVSRDVSVRWWLAVDDQDGIVYLDATTVIPQDHNGTQWVSIPLIDSAEDAAALIEVLGRVQEKLLERSRRALPPE